jgi:HAD superfamily hydrolase (TIGR01509 family)
MIKGILLDIDGTLVLSNDAHAHAWKDSFERYGYKVDFDDIRRLIGMGGDKLIAALQPQLTDKNGDGKNIAQYRQEIFLKTYVPSLKPTEGSREFVEALQANGLKTMVASSAKDDELSALLKAANLQDLLTEATTSDDAENSKPEPDIVQVALKKIGLSANEVVMIGDTPYDIEAAGKAGVKCIALRCGGWADDELSEAVAIYDDPADMNKHLAQVLDTQSD